MRMKEAALSVYTIYIKINSKTIRAKTKILGRKQKKLYDFRFYNYFLYDTKIQVEKG